MPCTAIAVGINITFQSSYDEWNRAFAQPRFSGYLLVV
jgi:hypothetical protein